LREYQNAGVLAYLGQLGLNGCLADDKGGKLSRSSRECNGQAEQANVSLCPTLLIAPTSVVGNWRKESKICPHLRAIVHHGSERANTEEFQAMAAQNNVVLPPSL